MGKHHFYKKHLKGQLKSKIMNSLIDLDLCYSGEKKGKLIPFLSPSLSLSLTHTYVQIYTESLNATNKDFSLRMRQNSQSYRFMTSVPHMKELPIAGLIGTILFKIY